MSQLIKSKIINTLMSLLICSTPLYSQNDFTVIKVYGNILNKKANKDLNQGDHFGEKDVLIFKTYESKAAVINPEKGRFIITPPADNNLTAQASFVPAMGNISSRAGLINNFVDLQNQFADKYLILDKVEIKISEDAYPMNENSFFYLRYQYEGESINKKLEFKTDTLIIEKKSLFTVDGKPIPNPDISEMKLFYYSDNKSVLINEFDPVFPDNEQLKAEISIILKSNIKKKYQERLNEIIGYLNEFYGKPNRDNVMEWLSINFDIR